jgi:hypothetical protein
MAITRMRFVQEAELGSGGTDVANVDASPEAGTLHANDWRRVKGRLLAAHR